LFYYLINSLKRRLIAELQDSFSRHPIYEKITPFIQNRFAFDERPQLGIVVKGSTANKVQLSADNFIGTVKSYVMLAYVPPIANPIEWVREDLEAVKANGDVMPTPPGVYYLEILTVPDNVNDTGTFVIDPLLTVTDEALLHFISGVEREAQLQQVPVKNTLRLWQDRRFLLEEGADYTVDYRTGAIRFIGQFPPDAIVTADYRYATQSIGPVPYQWNNADFKTLPGVVLAFGKRSKVGDKVAIVVYPDRVDTANAYGGRWDINFDLSVIVANDTNAMEEVADLAIMYMWGEKRANLSFDGIELTDFSMGGEAEESYDETADIRYYTASLSATFQSDWEIHIPLPLTISKLTPGYTGARDGSPPGLVSDIPGGLYFATVPIAVGRNDKFERIL
jgi:hypothetical protein